jgi:hypothetical protein
MKLFSFLGNKGQTPEGSELPDIFPLFLEQEVFKFADVTATYTKILTDVLERTHGIPQKQVPLLWDNCVQNATNEGLVTLLVCAMVKKTDLFLVYKKEVNVLRVATSTEANQIRLAYADKGESVDGIYISFRNYRRTDMLMIYSALEFCILASLHKTVNIAKAVQIKMNELRSSVSLADAGIAGAQAQSLATALKNGKDVFLDAKDEITTATPNIDPTEKAIDFLDAKRAYYLDLPISYVTGKQTGGIGSTGEGDMRAIERGLKQYFFSIIQPVLKAIFGIDVEFQSQDFRQMATALEAVKTFELVSDTILSTDAKRAILARLFDLDAKAEEKALDAAATEAAKKPPIAALPDAGATPAVGA